MLRDDWHSVEQGRTANTRRGVHVEQVSSRRQPGSFASLHVAKEQFVIICWIKKLFWTPEAPHVNCNADCKTKGWRLWGRGFPKVRVLWEGEGNGGSSWQTGIVRTRSTGMPSMYGLHCLHDFNFVCHVHCFIPVLSTVPRTQSTR